MNDSEEPSDEEQRLIKEIEKKIDKVKYFMEEMEELIEIQHYSEMEKWTNDCDNHYKAVRSYFTDRRIKNWARIVASDGETVEKRH